MTMTMTMIMTNDHGHDHSYSYNYNPNPNPNPNPKLNPSPSPVDKSTVRCGQVQTRVSSGKPGQDRARVKESRYVIKVMKGDRGRGNVSQGLQEPKDVLVDA